MRVFYEDGRAATLEVEAILGKGIFQFPKDIDVIGDIVNLVSEADDIVFDSFAGSGTTGHAVLKANAEDGGNRRFVLVEIDEAIAKDVTAERVRRVARGYLKPNGEKVEGPGGGFPFCRLSAEPLFDASGAIRADVRYARLAEFVWSRKPQSRPQGRLVFLFAESRRQVLCGFSM